MLHVVYITNRDRSPLPDYRARCSRIMLDVQAFYREEMARNGYGPCNFPLDVGADGLVKVHLVTLDSNFDPQWKWTPAALRPKVAEVLTGDGVDIKQSYFVAFENAYWQDGETWRYDVVYTGNGGPERGECWVTDHALLDATNFVPGRQIAIDDRGAKLSLGFFNAKMIGGLAHELGHGLGLPHNRETPLERRTLGKALMGGGNYTYRLERVRPGTGSFITAAHAFALSLHPLFGAPRLAEYTKPEVDLTDTQFQMVDGELLVSTRVEPADAVAGLVVYHDELPAAINQDYDAWSYLAPRTPDGRFVAAVDLPKPGKYALKLRIYFTNGLFRQFQFEHEINGERLADVPALETELVWQQTLTAFARHDAARLAELLPKVREKLPDRAAQASRMLAVATEWSSYPRPADVPAATQAISLSRTRWDKASVGWLIPSANGALDNLGRQEEALSTGGRSGLDGLFAHAPSRYDFVLDGQWSKLLTGYGLQNGHDGSVVFVVLVDGQERFRSPLVKLAEGEQKLSVDLTGARTLSLITETGPDGPNSDWGVWFEPVLKR